VFSHLTSQMIFAPLLGAFLQVFFISKKDKFDVFKWIALISSIIGSFCGLAAVLMMEEGTTSLQMSDQFAWIGYFSINYQVGIATNKYH